MQVPRVVRCLQADPREGRKALRAVGGCYELRVGWQGLWMGASEH